MLYKQYVRPYLEFASQASSPWLTGDKEELEKVQMKAVDMVSGLKGKSYEERCEELGLEILETRRVEQDMTLVYKLLSNGRGGDMFTKAGNHEGTRTRQAAVTNGLVVPYARTDIREYSFASRTIERQSNLPIGARAAVGQQAFKALLKTAKIKVKQHVLGTAIEKLELTAFAK
jgi:hypothetical protein